MMLSLLTAARMAATMSHELGHGLSMTHDTAGNDI